MSNTTELLDHGFIRLANLAGPIRRPKQEFDAADTDPANSARMSFGQMDKGRTEEADHNLAKYLIRNRHCYHPSMQVLTTRGWIRWDEANEIEEYLVPDPYTGDLIPEELSLLKFQNIEPMYKFANSRMEYLVTKGHKMWFKGKYADFYSKVLVEEKSNWGHFEMIHEYNYMEEDGVADLEYALLGFFLGDGSYASKGTVSFHLKKSRKIDYLVGILEDLGLVYKIKDSCTHGSEGVLIYMPTPDIISRYASGSWDSNKSSTRAFLGDVSVLDQDEVLGLFQGLTNSDGTKPSERRTQTSYSSMSISLVKLFETLATFLGYDAHHLKIQKELHMVTAYKKGRTALESRKDFHTMEEYSGDVYCTTSSTGLLMVRGRPDTYAFVCGNSTPLEMIEVWIEMKMPLFVARQFVRHRTATINEISGRYVKLPEEWYIPETVGAAAENVKQGQEGTLDEGVQEEFKRLLNSTCKNSYENYTLSINAGVAMEHARLFLHLNHYTQWLWKQDLSNIMRFLSLRDHSHTQIESQWYAQAIDAQLRKQLPVLMKAYDDYIRTE